MTTESVNGEAAQTVNYQYNGFNQQTSVSDGINTSSYTYRPDGLRHSKTVNEATTTHIWDGSNIVAELEGSVVTGNYIRGIL